MSEEYNGHKNWNCWNVSLWANNDEYIYRIFTSSLREWGVIKAAEVLTEYFQDVKTPDGATYDSEAITQTLKGMEE